MSLRCCWTHFSAVLAIAVLSSTSSNGTARPLTKHVPRRARAMAATPCVKPRIRLAPLPGKLLGHARLQRFLHSVNFRAATAPCATLVCQARYAHKFFAPAAAFAKPKYVMVSRSQCAGFNSYQPPKPLACYVPCFFSSIVEGSVYLVYFSVQAAAALDAVRSQVPAVNCFRVSANTRAQPARGSILVVLYMAAQHGKPAKLFAR